MHIYIYFSNFPILILLWVLNLHLFICSRDAYAVLKYLNDQCGVKKLGVIVFCWGGVAAHHMMLTYPKLRAGVSLYSRM